VRDMPHDWNLDQVPDLSGRVMIVTGANSGIGYEAALAFAKRKADVILACRNQDKAKAAADRIQNEAPTARLELIPLDLSDLSSVQAFALSFREGHSRLNGLINNAGVMALPQRTTTDGFEMQLGTNHLGHFALTGRLLDLLLATPGSRVVNVSSIAHKFGKIRFHDLQSEKSYSKWGAYGQSKLANLLFTHELDRRLKLSPRLGGDQLARSRPQDGGVQADGALERVGEFDVGAGRRCRRAAHHLCHGRALAWRRVCRTDALHGMARSPGDRRASEQGARSEGRRAFVGGVRAADGRALRVRLSRWGCAGGQGSYGSGWRANA